MRIDINQTLKMLDGRPVKDGETDLTLRAVLNYALIVGGTATVDKTPSGILKHTKLARKVVEAEGDLVVTAEEISVLKNCVAALVSEAKYNPVLVGIVLELLDPESVGS